MTAAVLSVLSPSFLSFRFYSLRWESLCKSLVHGNLETISSREKETAIHSSTPLPHHSINKNMPHSCYAVLFHRAKKLAAFVASQFCLILSLKGKIIWRSIVVLSLPGQQPAPAKICFWPISQIGNTTIALWYPAKAGGPLLAGKENVREVYYSDLPDSTGSSVAATSRPLSIQ